jgi:hypothetical protein
MHISCFQVNAKLGLWLNTFILQGLKNPGFIEKACRQVKCRFFHSFFRQNRLFETGVFTENARFWGSISVTTHCKVCNTL